MKNSNKFYNRVFGPPWDLNIFTIHEQTQNYYFFCLKMNHFSCYASLISYIAWFYTATNVWFQLLLVLLLLWFFLLSNKITLKPIQNSQNSVIIIKIIIIIIIIMVYGMAKYRHNIYKYTIYIHVFTISIIILIYQLSSHHINNMVFL